MAEFERLEKDGPHLIREWAQDEARRAEMVRLMGNEEGEIGDCPKRDSDQLVTTSPWHNRIFEDGTNDGCLSGHAYDENNIKKFLRQ
ncbi:MAG: hypothetical protein ACPGWR_01675 [Ardenticatenaceae bacterium]